LADGEPAAVGHGVAGVDGEVHEDLLDLARVGLDAAELGIELGGQLHVLADGAPQELVDARHRGVEVEDLGLQHLPAREGQELAGERRGLLAGRHDLVEAAAMGGLGGAALEPELSVADDRREQVVEVVGHAPGELADRFHALRLAQLLLELALLGDVAQDAAVGHDPARLVAHRGRRFAGRELAAVFPAQLELEVPDRAPLGQDRHQPPALAGVAVEVAADLDRHQLVLGAVAEELDAGAVDVEEPSFGSRDEDGVLRFLEQGPVFLFRAPHRFFRPLALGDVDEHGPGADHHAVRVGERQGVEQRVDDLAAAGHEPAFLRGEVAAQGLAVTAALQPAARGLGVEV
jgi:hypothetical protein